jgi:hypothetical protein
MTDHQMTDHPNVQSAAGRTLVLAALLVFVIAMLVPAPWAGAAQVTGGTADWAIKSSFNSYILNVPPAGTITASGGATKRGDSFRFSHASGNIGPNGFAGNVAFAGSIEYSKPGHGIELTIEDPRVAYSGATGTLYASGTAQGGDRYSNVDLATLDLTGITPSLSGNAVKLTGIPATLTEHGSEVFGGSYPAGTGFDPVSFAVTKLIGQVTPGKRTQSAGSGRVKFADISCSVNCHVQAPTRVDARIKGGAANGQNLELKVNAPSSLAAGKKGAVVAPINTQAENKLKRASAEFTVNVTLRANGKKVTKSTKVKVIG